MNEIEPLVVAQSKIIAKELEDSIVYQVQLKYDTQATAQSIVKRLQYADKLEKALDKACEELAKQDEKLRLEYNTNPLNGGYSYPSWMIMTKEKWKARLLKDD